MSFQYSAIGDNTPENREHLKKIGYDISCPCVRFKTSSLFTDKDGEVHTFQEEELGECLLEIKQCKCDLINCIGNPQLFKAVSAMRDDSDKWQFFVHKDGSFVFCDQGELKHVIDNEYMYQEYAVSEFHKATIDEIIKRFTKDENMQ